MGRLGIKVALLSLAAAAAMASGGSAGAAIDAVSGQIELLPSPPASVQPGALSSETTMRAFDERQHVTLTAPLSVNIGQPGTYKLVSDETPAVIPAGTVVNSQFVHVDKDTQFSTVLSGTIHVDSDILGIVMDNAAAQWLDASDFLGFPTTLYPAPLLFGRGFELNTNQQDKIVVHADRRTVDITSDIRLQLVDQLRIITVGNAPPVVDAGAPASGAEGSAIALSGSVTDADGTSDTSTWTYAPLSGVDAGATCSFANASSPATTITCTDDGVYTATLTADDGTNPPVSSSTTVTVSNANPQVTIDTPSAGSFLPGATIPLSASFTDAGRNDTHTCTIEWGDGAPASTGLVSESDGAGTCTGSHVYAIAASGSRTIVVTVTDDDGGAGTAQVTITVLVSPGVITPGQTSCADFAGGTAARLAKVNYSVSRGTIAQGINPGAFVFYTRVTTTSPNQVVTVSQTNTSTNNTPAFGILNGQASLWSTACASRGVGTVSGPNAGNASFTVPVPGTYIVGVKYQAKTIAGNPAPVPSTITYNFTTSLGGGATLQLVKS